MRTWLLLGLFALNSLFSTDMSPWVGSSYVLHANAGFLLQRSTNTNNEVDIAQLYFTGVRGNYKNFAGELELSCAHTKRCPFRFDHARQTIRYQFLDDILGDDYSMAAGVSLAEVTSQALHDESFIHRGHFESLLFISFGQELATSWSTWCQRAYGFLSLGLADHGHPWTSGGAFNEWAWPEGHIAGVGGTFDIGFGSKNIPLHHFHGYGNIGYRAIDLQGYYSHAFDRATSLKALLSARVYAHNCANAVSIALIYDVQFGL